jgi:hypothetical protein
VKTKSPAIGQKVFHGGFVPLYEGSTRAMKPVDEAALTSHPWEGGSQVQEF